MIKSEKELDPFGDLPLEILARVLDFLPQHHVYPFLSLSKGVDHIAKLRLFRQVYVIDFGKPFLHDYIEDLICWLVFSGSQFNTLLQSDFKWPGKLLLIGMLSVKTPCKDVRKRFKPAKVVFFRRIQDFGEAPYDIQLSNPKLFTTQSLSRLTLVGGASYEFPPYKLRVDNLLVFGNFRKIAECIDLSSVKQLSLVNAVNNSDTNICRLAAQLTSLQDLFISQPSLHQSIMKHFPKTIKRLVLNDVTHAPLSCVEPFQLLLTYLEIGNGAHYENWPRPLQKCFSMKKPQKVYFEKGHLPKLKMYVYFHQVFVKRPSSGNRQYYTMINDFAPRLTLTVDWDTIPIAGSERIKRREKYWTSVRLCLSR